MILTVNGKIAHLAKRQVLPQGVNAATADQYTFQHEDILLALNDIRIHFTYNPSVVVDAPTIGISIAGNKPANYGEPEWVQFRAPSVSLVDQTGQWDLEFLVNPSVGTRFSGEIPDFRYRFVTYFLGQRLWVQETDQPGPVGFNAGFGETLMGTLALCPLRVAFEEIRAIFLEKIRALGKEAEALLSVKLPPPKGSRFATLKADL
jgi:hypothetical protein